MDRVLLIIDDIQFNRQVEMSLRKVGFEVESINNEFSMNEPLLAFNPNYIIVRGQSSRLSVFNVGKKLRDTNTGVNAKVILVFPENFKLSADEIFKIRGDLLLNDPISTLRLVMYMISFTDLDAELIKEKLLKYALTDPQFRTNEQQILRHVGLTVDSEIEILSNTSVAHLMSLNKTKYTSDSLGKIINISREVEPSDSGLVLTQTAEKPDFESNEYRLDPAAIKRLKDEVDQIKDELPLRIDTYNRAIRTIDQDLKKGLNKRQTKKEFRELKKELLDSGKIDENKTVSLDQERIIFTNALFKKK